MQSSLFAIEVEDSSPAAIEQKPELGQWFTPEWAASELVTRYFPSLSVSDLVIEPSCGPGAFLKAIPDYVPAVGVEIDPALAQRARENTGREIITGDFTTVELPKNATAIIGNPPYVLSLFEQFLGRAHCILPELSKVGMLIPCYFMQTPSRVNAWLDRWSLRFDLVPRTLFPGLSFPIGFGVFSKDRRRDLVGFALYVEAEQVSRLSKRAQDVLRDGRPHRSVWRALVEDTIEQLGGKASLADIYKVIEPKRPTETAFWREKVRQQLQTHFTRTGPGEYALVT